MSDFDPWGDDLQSVNGKRSLSSFEADEFDPFGEAAQQGGRRATFVGSEEPTIGSSKQDLAPTILSVCTGNICRSPYFERVLDQLLDGTGVRLASAGTNALVGRPIDPGTQILLEARGIDSGGFQSQQVTQRTIEDAELILTASREHRKKIVQQVPTALHKTFALSDFSDLCKNVEIPSRESGRGKSGIADLIDFANGRRALVSAPSDDLADIVDPFRKGFGVFMEMERQSLGRLITVADAIKYWID